VKEALEKTVAALEEACEVLSSCIEIIEGEGCSDDEEIQDERDRVKRLRYVAIRARKVLS
jgi:tRNA A58 N-methylase Trm61